MITPLVLAATLLFAPATRPVAAAEGHGTFAGSVPPSTTVSLYVRLQGRHEDRLDALIAAQSTPGSNAYLHYLTPQQFGAYFGADPRDYARAISVLRARGFVIDGLPANRTDLIVHASAASVEAFFGTPLDLRTERGRIFFTNRYVPMIPPELHAVAVSGLDDYFTKHPMSVRRPFAVVDRHFSWAPADLAAAYDLNPLYAGNLNGTGVTIANATCGAASTADLTLFERQFGLPSASLISQPIAGPLSATCHQGGGGNGESSLDADWATAVARNASFEQVVAYGASNHDFDLVYSYIVNTLGSTVHVVTTSWGACEQQMRGTASLTIDDRLFKQAAAEGQHWFSASGDSGTDDCYDGTKAVSVDYPGSSPYVMSVGGTNVKAAISQGNVTAWVAETTWQYSNSQGASGGGKSILYAKPSYQQKLTPNDGVRDVPDVSALSDQINDGVWMADDGQLLWGWGGTSEAAPQWAGLLAIVEQRRGNRAIADPHVRLYQLAASSAYHSVFHDVVSGNNGVPAGVDPYGTFPGYNAGPGFDLTSGLGSYIGAALVNAY